MASYSFNIPALKGTGPGGAAYACWGYKLTVTSAVPSSYTVPNADSCSLKSALLNTIFNIDAYAQSAFSGGTDNTNSCADFVVLANFGNRWWCLKKMFNTNGGAWTNVNFCEFTSSQSAQSAWTAMATSNTPQVYSTLIDTDLVSYFKTNNSVTSGTLKIIYAYIDDIAGSPGTVKELKTVSVPIYVPTSWVPSFEFAIQDITNPVKNKYYVGKSGVSFKVSNISLPGNATKNASSSNITFQGSTVAISGNEATLTKNPITQAGTLTATAKVVDSRGKSATHQITIVAFNHANPVISQFTARRCDADGGANEEGKSAAVMFSAAAVSDANQHSLDSATLKWRTTNGEWSAPISVLDNNGAEFLIPGVEFSTNDQYELMLEVTDDAGYVSSATATLFKAFMTMDFKAGGHGIAFGGPSTDDGFTCYMDAKFPSGIKGGLTVLDGGIKITNGNIIRLDTGYTDSGTASNSAVRYNTVYFQDSTGFTNTYLEQAVETNGTIRAGLRIQKKKSDGSTANYPVIQGSVDNAGNLVYGLGNVNAFRNLGFMGARTRDGHLQVVWPNGVETGWLRCTGAGFIPYNSDSGASNCHIGSGKAWQFTNIWGKNFYVDGVNMANIISVEADSGSWHYRQYKNGRAEAWFEEDVNVSGMATDNWHWMSYGATFYRALPFTFKTVKFMSMFFNSGTIFAIGFTCNSSNTQCTTNATRVGGYPVSAQAYNGAQRLRIYIEGTC